MLAAAAHVRTDNLVRCGARRSDSTVTDCDHGLMRGGGWRMSVGRVVCGEVADQFGHLGRALDVDGVPCVVDDHHPGSGRAVAGGGGGAGVEAVTAAED